MRFLSWWWIPFWLWTFLVQSYGTRHHNVRDNASLGISVFLWLGLNVIVTVCYLIGRALKKGSADAQPRR